MNLVLCMALLALLTVHRWQLTAATDCGISAVLMDVEPQVLKTSGDEVKVLWPCISKAIGDWVGIYDGATGEYMFTRHDLLLADTSHVYKLYNMRRGGYFFRYYRSGGELVAQSQTVTFEMGDSEPTQLHTALTNDGKSVRVMWVTDRPDEPFVIVDEGSPTLSPSEHVGTSTTHHASDMCEPSVIWQEPGWMHDVLVNNLMPGKTYEFRYGNRKSVDVKNGQSFDIASYSVETKQSHFSIVWAPRSISITMPPSVGQAKSFDALFVGDMGNSQAYCKECTIPEKKYDNNYIGSGSFAPASAQVVSAMNRSIEDVAFVAHIGDLAYSCGVEMKWDYWMQTIQPLTSHLPYMVSVGNHEYGYNTGAEKDPSGAHRSYRSPGHEDAYGDDSHGECGVPTFHRFHMPDNGNSVFWYSMDVGLAHFSFLSLEHNISEGSPQYTWLVADLSKVDRTRTPWLIVSGHRPLYCSEFSAVEDFGNGLYLATILDDVFKDYNVNLYLAGHYHAYERTCPIYKGKCLSETSATTHITVGTAGWDLDLGNWSASWSVLHFDPAFGYGRLSVINASALRWQYVNVTLDGTESLLDEHWLHQSVNEITI